MKNVDYRKQIEVEKKRVQRDVLDHYRFMQNCVERVRWFGNGHSDTPKAELLDALNSLQGHINAIRKTVETTNQ